MAISSQLNELTPTVVTAEEERLVEMLLEELPSLDLNPGRVLRALLIRPAALFAALNNLNVNKLQRSQSLLEVEEDPALADTTTVDAILSNFLLSRESGTKASGQISIVVDERVTTSIPAGTVFTSTSGFKFANAATFTGVTDSSLVNTARDRLMTQRSDNKYVFTVDVVAAVVGAASEVGKDTRFTLDPQPPRFFDAFAGSDFTGGKSTETNQAAVARLRTGITAQTVVGRGHIEALLRNQFTGILDISTIGYGDLEMRRDSHNFFSISQGGKVDIYPRTRNLPIRTTVTKSAVLVDAAQQIWQLSFGRDEYPGLYQIDSVLPVGSAASGTLELISDVRAMNITGYDFVPLVVDVNEGVYSRFQTVQLRFKDPNTPTTSLMQNVSTKNYSVTLLYMPQIGEIQDLLLERSRRHPQADHLVRAPIPCFIGVELRITHHRSDAAIDTVTIKQAVIEVVNGTLYTVGQVSAAAIVDAVGDLLPSQSSIKLPVHLYATLRQPDGTELITHVTDVVEPPSNPTLSISNRTVAFFTEIADVDVEVVESGALEV